MRDAIDELIAECTDAQVAGLHRIHDNAPWKGLGNCPADKLSTAYELLRRTVMQNIKAAGSATLTAQLLIDSHRTGDAALGSDAKAVGSAS